MNLENMLSKKRQMEKDYTLYNCIYMKCPEKAEAGWKLSGAVM